MDFTEVKHEAHAAYPAVVVMRDGHVRGPFKSADAAEKWAAKQEKETVSHAKPLIPADADYAYPEE